MRSVNERFTTRELASAREYIPVNHGDHDHSEYSALTASAPSAPASGIVLQAGQVITARGLAGPRQRPGANRHRQPDHRGGNASAASGRANASIAGLADLKRHRAFDRQSAEHGPSQAGASARAATSDPVITLSPSLAASLAANLTADAVTPDQSADPARDACGVGRGADSGDPADLARAAVCRSECRQRIAEPAAAGRSRRQCRCWRSRHLSIRISPAEAVQAGVSILRTVS